MDGLSRDRLGIDTEVAARLRAFLASDVFRVRSSIAKTSYWEHHSSALQADVDVDSARVTGSSGYYVAPSASLPRRLAAKLRRAAGNPAQAAAWLRARLWPFAVPRLMTYEQAFDAVMTHAPVSDPDLSPFLINHRHLARRPQVYPSAAAVKQHYASWSRHFASGNIICHYYYQNLLRGYLDSGSVRAVLEIGPGNGNFPSILFHDWAPVRIVLIDLPEALAVSIPFLSNLFPQARLALPNEIQSRGFPREYDFAFLTVDQTGLVPEGTVDLALNCHSFQEMTHAQIRVYIELIQRVCRDGGWFFNANRVEKLPCGPDSYMVEQPDPPNRMAEYPWYPENELLFYQVSKLSRLVQLDAVAVRLERVRKSVTLAQ